MKALEGSDTDMPIAFEKQGEEWDLSSTRRMTQAVTLQFHTNHLQGNVEIGCFRNQRSVKK